MNTELYVFSLKGKHVARYAILKVGSIINVSDGFFIAAFLSSNTVIFMSEEH